jgi:DNA-binding transcriptional MerR regulator
MIKTMRKPLCCTIVFVIIKNIRRDMMDRKETFSVSEFAEFSRTTRDTLLYYDKIGLVSPELRGENGYRYYSSGQLGIVNLIRSAQALGMKLSRIQYLKDHLNPLNFDEFYQYQIKLIDEKIDEWIHARKLLNIFKNVIESTFNIDEDEITIQFRPAEAIIMGDLNDYSQGRNAYDALLSFYRSFSEKYPDLDLNYPVWAMFSEERIRRRDWVWPDRYYFYNPEGHDKKAGALYAIGYKRCWYGQGDDLYERMLDYIGANGFEISGPAYEEYPINELCTLNREEYLLRLMITVRVRD